MHKCMPYSQVWVDSSLVFMPKAGPQESCAKSRKSCSWPYQRELSDGINHYERTGVCRMRAQCHRAVSCQCVGQLTRRTHSRVPRRRAVGADAVRCTLCASYATWWRNLQLVFPPVRICRMCPRLRHASEAVASRNRSLFDSPMLPADPCEPRVSPVPAQTWQGSRVSPVPAQTW